MPEETRIVHKIEPFKYDQKFKFYTIINWDEN